MQSARAYLIAPLSCSSSAEESEFRNPCSDSLEMNSALSFPLTGDYIGMESCVDLTSGYDDPAKTHSRDGECGAMCSDSPGIRYRWRREDRKTKKKEYPPPIPLLARTENLHSHMPWVLRRHYTCDGRLILTEEKVKHHEYFRAHRTNGRLTLQLVALDDEVSGPPIAGYCDCEFEADEVERAESSGSDVSRECENGCDCNNDEAGGSHDYGVVDGDDDDDDEVVVKMEDETTSLKLASSFAELTMMESGNGGIGGHASGKCCNFSSVSVSVSVSVSSSSSCIFGVPVPAL